MLMHEDASFLSIVRRIKAIPKQEEGWKHNSIFRTIFRTIVHCKTESRMLIIDGGSKMNVVSKATNRTTSKIIQGSVDK